MTTDLRLSTVRILKPNGKTAGTGFALTYDGLIATCAHVIASAGAKPGGTVPLVFHSASEPITAIVEPSGWRDPKAEDTAILRLKGLLPNTVPVFSLGPSTHTANHHFETFGFPDANPDEGLWGRGNILRETSISGVRVLQLRSQEVTPGFSGAPIWDTTTQLVVGMVTAITNPDNHGRLTETAFATPVEVLMKVWPDLCPSDVCPYRGLEAFTLNDAAFFFGRKRVVNRLLESLRRESRFCNRTARGCEIVVAAV